MYLNDTLPIVMGALATIALIIGGLAIGSEIKVVDYCRENGYDTGDVITIKGLNTVTKFECCGYPIGENKPVCQYFSGEDLK